MKANASVPQTQHAIQLVGPGQLRHNREKAVPRPGPFEILARVEAVGLCFSDLKLLQQFDRHPRKSEVVRGLDPEVLKSIPSYVPGKLPVVPGHEVVCRIVAVGASVKRHQVGERCLVQTDYRNLPTAGSCAAFGYNFEGGLQEYVVMDERVVMDGGGRRFLIPVGEEKSASAVALVEPWACVEDSYVNRERKTIKAGGRLLVVVEAGHRCEGLREAFAPEGPPAELSAFCVEAGARGALESLGLPLIWVGALAELKDEGFDDIVYFGSQKASLELLNDKLAARGTCNVVLGGGRIGAAVSVGVGRVHYGMTRWTGTPGTSAAEAYRHIPTTGEIRAGERIVVIGAGGPMGQMHVIRDICCGAQGVSVTGTDFDDARLEALRAKAAPLARANGVGFELVNTKNDPAARSFTYYALMAPVGALVAEAVRTAAEGAIINIFAGIPAPTRQEIDLDAYITKRCFMFGTSGSVIEDMEIVLGKLQSGRLDTNCSIDAVSGMAGAIAGIEAVEKRTLAGKIIVYPMLHELGLVPLPELASRFPTVAAQLSGGQWTRAAEEELLRVAAEA